MASICLGLNELTHCGLVKPMLHQRTLSPLCQAMHGTCAAPSHYLIQCWFIVIWTSEHTLLEFKSKYRDLLLRKYAWQYLQNVSDLLKPQCVTKRYLDGKSCWTWMSISVIPSCLFLSESEILQHFWQHQLHISIGQNAYRNHHGNELTMGIQYSGLYS